MMDLRVFGQCASLAVPAALIVFLDCRPAVADDREPEPQFIIAGPATTPEYMGSDDYQTVPMIVSQFDLLGAGIEVEGLTAWATVFERGAWRLGGSLNFDMGRDEDVDNAAVASMAEIDATVNLGAFAAYTINDTFLEGDSLQFRTTLFGDSGDSHDGAFLTTDVTYTLPLYIPWRFEFELETTYADDSYMETYFGVNTADALASGLPTYGAGSSIRDVSLAANVAFFLNPKWGGFARLGVTKFLGDAADSPITELGTDTPYFVGLGVFYRFGEE